MLILSYLNNPTGITGNLNKIGKELSETNIHI